MVASDDVTVTEGWSNLRTLPKKSQAALKNPSKNNDFSEKPLAFDWPCRGTIASSVKGSFNAQKGITIKNQLGSPITAAAKGKVIYCGHGLKDYGNLIILKHKNDFFTTYAYNKKTFVKEGQVIEKHQKIAEMGLMSGTNTPGLYFEIRKKGVPVNTVDYLAKR